MCKISLNKSSCVVKYFYVPHLLVLKKCNTTNTIFLKAILHICFHFPAFGIQVHFRRKYLFFSLYSFHEFSMYFQRKSDISVPPVAVILFLFRCDVTTCINYISRQYKEVKKTLF